MFTTERELITLGMTFTSAFSVRCYEVIHQVASGGGHFVFPGATIWHATRLKSMARFNSDSESRGCPDFESGRTSFKLATRVGGSEPEARSRRLGAATRVNKSDELAQRSECTAPRDLRPLRTIHPPATGPQIHCQHK